MADQILACNKVLSADSSVNGYDFTYQFDDGQGNQQVTHVFIQAANMTNATDTNEATTLANKAAADKKALWAQALADSNAPPPVAVAAALGPVTLPAPQG